MPKVYADYYPPNSEHNPDDSWLIELFDGTGQLIQRESGYANRRDCRRRAAELILAHQQEEREC